MAKNAESNGYKKGGFVISLVVACLLVLGTVGGVIVWGQDCKGEIRRAHTRIDGTEDRVDRLEKHLSEKYDDMRSQQREMSRKMDRIIELQMRED